MFSRLVPVAALAMVTGLLAGCYETRSTLAVTSTSNATLTHSHYVYVDAFGGDTDAAIQFVENTYPGFSGTNISKDGYLGKRYVITGLSNISSFDTDTGDRVTIQTPEVDGQTVVRVAISSELREPDNNEGYKQPLFTVTYPSNWTHQIVSTGGGSVVRTAEGLTFVGPAAGNSWSPVIDLKPPALRQLGGDGPDIEVLDGNGNDPEISVVEPEIPEVDIIEPGGADTGTDPGLPADAGGVDFGNPGDFDDFYDDSGTGTTGTGLPGGVDFGDFYGEDGSLPSIEDLFGADGDVGSTSGGPGLLMGVFTGLALGGVVSGVIVLLARRKNKPVATAPASE